MRIGRASQSLGHIPETWTESRLIFIPKVSRANLTSFILKTIERVVGRYILEKLKEL